MASTVFHITARWDSLDITVKQLDCCWCCLLANKKQCHNFVVVIVAVVVVVVVIRLLHLNKTNLNPFSANVIFTL